MIAQTPIVKVRGLTKRFKRTTALDGVDLDVHAGHIIGLLGDNGAGKSTLLRHMVGLYLPDAGSCMTLGCEAGELTPEHLARIGYVHQDGELLDWMTCRQLIQYVSAYYPTWNRDLEETFVRDFEIPLKTRVGVLSPGQRQRLAILLAIGFEPELLILDEPAAALDPLARLQFLDLLVSLIQDATRTIIISSHILTDVEKVIDHALIMRQGRFVRDCRFDELQEEFCRLRLSAIETPLPDALPFTTILEEQRANGEALLLAPRPTPEELSQAERDLRCRVEVQTLALDDIYRLVIQTDDQGTQS
jgi:ABC-2 type transport system ATP-binding protein